jgi:aspartate dehydrogenase
MKVGLIGAGAIGTYLLEELNYKKDTDIRVTSIFVRNWEKYQHLEEKYNIRLYTALDEFLSSDIDIVVEAANVQTVRELLPKIVRQKDTVVISIGALADEKFLNEIKEIIETNGHKLHLPSGAIGGLDLIENVASVGIIDKVSLVTNKPAHTLTNKSIDEAEVVYKGNAADAIKRYPKNINVSIALALAGIGFKQTEVTLIADPGIAENIHSIEVSGDFGKASFSIRNKPLPSNKNTSYLAAVSILGTLKKITRGINMG